MRARNSPGGAAVSREAEGIALLPSLRRRVGGYEYVDLWINQEIRNSSIFKELVEQGSAMVEKAEKLIRATQDLVAQLEEVDSAAAVQREIAVVAIELKELVKACEAILFSGSDQYVYAAHMCRKAERGGDAIEALSLQRGPSDE